MKHFKSVIVLFVLFSGFQLKAQESVIRGAVIDNETGEPLIGVAVVIEGTTIGDATNLEGEFNIKVAAGKYNLTVAFISYTRLKLPDVVVKAGEATDMGLIKLTSSSEFLQEFVVTAKEVKNTEAAMINMKKNSSNLIDGISAASFKKIGDSDAASAITRVTGVSVQGGKYVYVRGLGDRYTKTTLNGMDLPGLDPDRNSVQMDIFPTNIIDNIVVSKSFTADLPADFTGGAVDISLKDFPERKIMSAGVSLGFNPAMNLNKQYITYNGGKTDFLGFDDGTRDIPTDGQESNIPQYAEVVGNPNSSDGQVFQKTLRGFDKQMGGYRQTSGLNSGLNFTYANQLKGERKYDVGYSMALNYQNSTEFYEGAEFNLYGKPNNSESNELIALQTQKGDYGVNNVLLGGTAGLAFKKDDFKLKFSLLHLQNGESQAGVFDYRATDNGTTFLAKQHNLQYSERALTNFLTNGVHQLGDDWELDWKLAATRSTIDDPDIRFMRFQVNENTGEVMDRITTEVGFPERIWRFLTEYNISSKADVTRNYQLFGETAKFKTGGKYTYKTRNYTIQGFQINPGRDLDLNGDPNQLFDEDNLYDEQNMQGVYHVPTFIPRNPNKYDSQVNHTGVYASNEFMVNKDLKAIVGLRAEHYQQFYTGTNQTGDKVLNNEKVMDDVDLFPTANFIYSVNKKQNIRASYARTIARPSFKEMSYAEIIDPITGRAFGGGLFEEKNDLTGETYWDGDLHSTKINNFDIRWEMFPSIGQTISVSAFYKMFNDPIEIVQYLSDPGLFQARNVGDAKVLGGEFELIQSLGIIHEKLSDFKFNTNITLTTSSIVMSRSEYQSRQNTANDGEIISNKRAMAGQAPYVINAGLSYTNKEKGMQANISYQVQGETLEFVGFGNNSDVYIVPFKNLSMKLGKSFGKEDKMNISFKGTNLLNSEKVKVFKSTDVKDQIFTRLLPQRTFSISFSYNFY
jgi:TonB-dependent receptor